ncbi:MAG TPA: MOSC domain-containing protein [Acidimicrobiales bacterium]|nr:MOSC domain-containing protein [Acidimicrobiales bacterium]
MFTSPSSRGPVNALGTVAQCWCYPVKSMQGQPRGELSITAAGVDGDRAWAVIDAAANRILSAKRTAALLGARASDDAIELPDGSTIALEDPDASAALSRWLTRDVRLARPRPGEQLAYQMTFDPPNDDAEYYDIPAPEGSFVDLAPLHLVTTATLSGCAKARPDLDWDVRRFRPNVVIDIDGEAFCEDRWSGQAIQVGTRTVLEVAQPTVRCAMPLRSQPGLQRQPRLFGALNELNPAFPNHLGVYARVRTPGPIRVGDPVTFPS